MSKDALPPSHIASQTETQHRELRPQRTLIFLLLAACLLCTLAAEEWLSIGHLSMTFDEGAHLYGGYRHWTARDFGVNPEHPPLVKLVATVPLLSMHLKPPNPPQFIFMAEEYGGGGQMLGENGVYRLLTPARIAASLFTFALALLMFFAGWEMFGLPAGLMTLALFTFEPTVLAHGALVTTDMGVACFTFAAVYAFYRYLRYPAWSRLVLCGLGVGLALSAKVSGVLVLPVLLLIALWEVIASPSSRAQRAGALLRAILVIFAIGYVVLWASYTFRYAARPSGMALAPPLVALAHMGPGPWQTSLVLHLAQWHVLPEGYLYAWTKLGTPLTTASGFLFGRIYPTGTWFYFPSALLIKSTLTLLILLVAAPFVLKRHEREAVIPAIALFTILLASMPSHLNIGVRHVLSIYPFAILLAAAAGLALARRSRLAAAVVAALLLFQFATSLHAYPDYLPYANEAFGGSSKTYRLLADSNVDWGQHVKEVNAWTASHNVTDCWFADTNLNLEKTPCRPLPSFFDKVVVHSLPSVPAHLHGTVLISALDASGVLWGPGILNPYKGFLDGRPAELIGNSVLVYQGDFDVPRLSAESHLNQGLVLLRGGQADAALKEIQAAIEVEPNSPSVQIDAGGALLQMHRIPEAQQAFATAMRKSAELSKVESQVIADRIATIQQPSR